LPVVSKTADSRENKKHIQMIKAHVRIGTDGRGFNNAVSKKYSIGSPYSGGMNKT